MSHPAPQGRAAEHGRPATLTTTLLQTSHRRFQTRSPSLGDHWLSPSTRRWPGERRDTAKPSHNTASKPQALPRPCFSRPGDHARSRTGAVGEEGGEDMLTCLLKGSWRPVIRLTVPFNHCLSGPYLNGCPRGVSLARALPNSQAS